MLRFILLGGISNKYNKPIRVEFKLLCTFIHVKFVKKKKWNETNKRYVSEYQDMAPFYDFLKIAVKLEIRTQIRQRRKLISSPYVHVVEKNKTLCRYL